MLQNLTNKEALYGSAKILLFFTAGLYSLGFSLNGVNVYGIIDALIPFERALCFAVAVSLWFLMLKSGVEMFKKW